METFVYLCSENSAIMEQKPKFKIIYSDDVISFLNGLESKVRVKIMYNINKSKFVMDKSIFQETG